MNWNLLSETIAIFWDEAENFFKPVTQQKIGKKLFQEVFLVTSLNEFEQILESYESEQKILFFIHLFHNEDNKGYDTFISSKIKMHFPSLVTYLISSAPRRTIYEKEVNTTLDVYPYDGFHSKVGELFIPQIKADIIGIKTDIRADTVLTEPAEFSNTYPQIDYAIITALYKDEFEELHKVFNFPVADQIRTAKKVYHVGYLKSNNNIKVVAAIPNATGMVDASIIATQMLEFFRPKWLLMSGVCGGAKDYKIGDIIVAKQIFTFQKGKLSDIKRKDEKGDDVKIELFDSNNAKIDYNHLYDNEGNQIAISIEKFQVEHDSMISMNTLFEDTLMPYLESINSSINDEVKKSSFFERDLRVNIVVGPIACSTMVINREGFFEDTIRTVNRKTAAVEMESYGVARACEFANKGETKPIIFKSVMDNTSNKVDSNGGMNYKKFAAFTSAQFMKQLFEKNII
jgi:nucleoside phosphorylase